MTKKQDAPEVETVREQHIIVELTDKIKGWPAVLWGLILGTGVFTFSIVMFINNSISTKVMASETKIMTIMDERKVSHDLQYENINTHLEDLKKSNERIEFILMKKP